MMASLMFKFRTFLFNLGFILACITISILGFSTCFFSYRICHWWSVVFGRFINFWLKLTCNITVEIQGKEHLPKQFFSKEFIPAVPKQPYVVLANHQSAWETFALQAYFYPLVTVLKKELLMIPLWGWSLRLIHPIVLDRKQKRQALVRVIRQGKAALKRGYNILLFPEGTRAVPPAMGEFSRSGVGLACAMGCPVILVAHNAGLYWPARKWSKRPGIIKVSVSKPIITQGKKVNEVYQEAVSWMQSELSVLNYT